MQTASEFAFPLAPVAVAVSAPWLDEEHGIDATGYADIDGVVWAHYSDSNYSGWGRLSQMEAAREAVVLLDLPNSWSEAEEGAPNAWEEWQGRWNALDETHPIAIALDAEADEAWA